MRGRALFLPVFTAAAVLLAVSLPMGTLQQWDRNYQWLGSSASAAIFRHFCPEWGNPL